MSKITVANRKFLEEQVKNCLKEFNVNEPSYFTRMDPVASAAYDEGLSAVLPALKGAIKDIAQIPAWIATVTQRFVFTDGDRARQAILNSNAPSDVKQFFATYKINNKRGFDLLDLNERNFVTLHKEKLQEVSQIEDTEDMYEALVDIYGSVSDLVLVKETSAKQIIEAAKKKQIPKEDVLKLFFRRFFAEQWKSDKFLNNIIYSGSSLINYLDADKEQFFNQLQEGYKDQFGAFVLYSSMDPMLTKGLEEWVKAYAETIKKVKQEQDSMLSTNITALLMQMGVGIKVENAIAKKLMDSSRPLIAKIGAKASKGFWGPAIYGILLAVAFNGVANYLDNKWGPSSIERDQIKNSIATTRATAQQIAEKRKDFKFTNEDIKQLQEILMEPLEILLEEFRQKSEKSALITDAKTLASAFTHHHRTMNQLKDKIFDSWSNINNKEDYDNFLQELDKMEKVLDEEYSKVRMSADVLQEQATQQTPQQVAIKKAKADWDALKAANKLDKKYLKPTGFIDFVADELLKSSGLSTKDKEDLTGRDKALKGVMVTDNDIKKSGLTEDKILQIMKWYNIEGQGALLSRGDRFDALLNKTNKLQSTIDKIKEQTLRPNLAKFNTQFIKDWENYARPLKGQKVRFLTEDSYSNLGLSAQLKGRGRLFDYNESYSMILAPLLWYGEDNSSLTIADVREKSTQFQDLYQRSMSLKSGSKIDLFSARLGKNDSYKALMQTKADTDKAFGALSGSQSGLAKILQIHKNVLDVLESMEKELKSEEVRLVAYMRGIDGKIPNNLQDTDENAELKFNAIKKMRAEGALLFTLFNLYSRLEEIFEKFDFRFQG